MEIRITDSNYPEKLKRLKSPPEELHVVGAAGLPATDVPTVAIFGARMASEYGRYMARQIGQQLADNGINVISTMAMGVSGIALRGALSGTPYAVMGCGVDTIYPPENMDLYEKLKEHGGIISQLSNAAKPEAKNFPEATKLAVGFADAVVIVEARKKSGALLAADFANEIGIPVYAVPGRATDRLSDGCNTLIKNGAEILFNIDDLLSNL